MKCPVCTTTELLISERQGIEIDYCGQCRGVWLDRGELDKLIERSAATAIAPTPAPAPRAAPQQYANDQRFGHGGHGGHGQYQGAYHDQKRKKKSFLGEIFDFG